MFIWQQEKDKYGKRQLHYILTQGDSCGIKFRPIDTSTKEPIDHTLIDKILFKLYKNDESKQCIFHKEFEYLEDETWLFDLLPEENIFPLDRYKYEIEVTFVGGAINTPCQWYFDIIEQAVCK